ncbi:MAG: hypothetical protein ACRDF0_03165 [Candidatus Limnocylindria bacterium]
MVYDGGLNWPSVHYLQRWPSPRSMRRVRQRIHELTDRRQSGAKDVRVPIE